VTLEEVPALDLAVITVPEGWRDRAVHRFTQTGHGTVHPSAVNNATDRFALLFVQGARYELVYRYETWVQYVSRRPRPRVDLTSLATELSAEEPGPAAWTFDGVAALAPSLRLAGAEVSAIAPDRFRARLEEFLRAAPPGWDPYG
jgi:hypothetical protein